jgi:hypothetical protein
MDYISIKGKQWWGTGELKTESVETENECIALCETDEKCSGATFNSKEKMCWTRSGDSEIVDDDESGTDYALIKKLKYHMTLLKSLNLKLLELNEKIINKIKSHNSKSKTESNVETYTNKEDIISSNIFNDYYKVLLNHKRKTFVKIYKSAR